MIRRQEVYPLLQVQVQVRKTPDPMTRSMYVPSRSPSQEMGKIRKKIKGKRKFH